MYAQKRAAVGGELGANGEFYEGGKFIATTEREKGKPQPKRPSAPHNQQVERYLWQLAPSPHSWSIYTVMTGTYAGVSPVGYMYRFEPHLQTLRDENVRYMGNDLGNVDELIARFNSGERWVEEVTQ